MLLSFTGTQFLQESGKARAARSAVQPSTSREYSSISFGSLGVVLAEARETDQSTTGSFLGSDRDSKIQVNKCREGSSPAASATSR